MDHCVDTVTVMLACLCTIFWVLSVDYFYVLDKSRYKFQCDTQCAFKLLEQPMLTYKTCYQ